MPAPVIADASARRASQELLSNIESIGQRLHSSLTEIWYVAHPPLEPGSTTKYVRRKFARRGDSGSSAISDDGLFVGIVKGRGEDPQNEHEGYLVPAPLALSQIRTLLGNNDARFLIPPPSSMPGWGMLLSLFRAYYIQRGQRFFLDE